MVREVTDPALLAELNGDGEVTDPAILAQLNGEAPAAPPDPPPTNTLGQEFGRQAGLAGRALASAAGSFGTIPADAIGKAVNYVAGREVVPNQRRALNQTLTRMGFPEPERGIEKFTQGIAESAPAFALPVTNLAQMGGNATIAATQAKPGQEANDALLGTIFAGLPNAVNLAGRAVKAAVPTVLGMTTGAGRESVEQAFKGTPEFVANMRGHVPAAEVVEQARAGVGQMRQQMHDAYKQNKQAWAAGQQPLDLAPVKQAYDDVLASFGHGGFSKVGPAEQRVLQEASDVLTEFASNPKWHTTEGFDALKQRLSAIYPESPQMRQAQRAVSTMATAARQAIEQQNPAYANAMKDYWQRSAQLDEIERSLSLGNNATTDTALRKLQSLMRNNANTNYGQRLNSADALAQQGGVDVQSAVAGQAMNSWTPRGLQALGATGVGGYGLANPASLALLPAMSPRLVGEAASGAGRMINPVLNDPRTIATLNALRRIAPTAAAQGGRERDGE